MRIRAWAGVAGAESSPGKGTSGEEAQGEEEEAIRRVMELKSVPGVGGGGGAGEKEVRRSIRWGLLPGVTLSTSGNH